MRVSPVQFNPQFTGQHRLRKAALNLMMLPVLVLGPGAPAQAASTASPPACCCCGGHQSPGQGGNNGGQSCHVNAIEDRKRRRDKKLDEKA